MHSIQNFEPECPELIKRPWTQFNAHQDVGFCSLADAPVAGVRKCSEKEIGQVPLSSLQKVVAVQRAEVGGPQKRTRATRRTEKARKKYCRHYAQDNYITDSQINNHGKDRAESSSSQDAAEAGPSTPFTPSIINFSAGACIIVGQDETSEMDLRNYADTESNPDLALPYAKTPPNSPQIENSFPLPCRNSKGSLNNQEAISKVSEALLSLQKPGGEHEEYQNSLTTTEKATANTTKQSTQPQSDGISSATLSTTKRLLITDLLNYTEPNEHTKPLQLTTMMTTSGGLPVTDTGRGKLQGEMAVRLLPHIMRSTSFRREPSKMASCPETSSLGQASGASELALVCASDNKSTSGPRNDSMPLEGKVVAQRLSMVGKILITKSDMPNSTVTLSIHPLLSQNAPDFFRFYSRTAGAGEVSMLCFGFPDVTWQSHQIQNISCGDIKAFYALKQTIWDYFCIFLRRGPGSAVFRVEVTVPALKVANNTVTFSSKTEYNRVSASWNGPDQNLAATNPGLKHFPQSSQVAVSSSRTSNSQKALPIGFQPTLRGSDVLVPRQSRHSTAKFPAGPARNVARRTLRNRLPPLQIAPTPQYQHSLSISQASAFRQDKQVRETPSAVQIAVRIQENEHSRFSRPYSKSILLSEVTAMDFFTWFARSSGYAYPSGPPELKFILKDALPESKSASIRRGDEANFQFMKEDIKPHFERAKALMPELTEFAILVTVPGWAVDK